MAQQGIPILMVVFRKLVDTQVARRSSGKDFAQVDYIGLIVVVVFAGLVVPWPGTLKVDLEPVVMSMWTFVVVVEVQENMLNMNSVTTNPC